MAMHITRTGVTLTVGIIVLTALLTGGLFWVKNAGEQARRQEAITTAEQNLKDEADKDVAIGEDKEKTESSQSGESGSSSTSESAGTSSDSSSTAGDSSSSTSALPQTGPADTVLVAAILGVATFAATGYVQSRRRV